MKFTCCGADPESDDYISGIDCQCHNTLHPPCRGCERSSDICVMCGSEDFDIVDDDEFEDNKATDNYDRAMKIFD
jgi:hypothetical protein